MKKVLFISKQLRQNFDGASKILTMIANYFYGSDFEVYCYAYSGIMEDGGLHSNIHRIKGVNKGSLYSFVEVRKILKKVKPDVVISFITNANVLLLISSIGTRIPTIVCERSDPYLETSKKLVVMRKLYRLSSGAVFQTKEAQEYYSWVKNSTVIPNPISKSNICVRKKFEDRENSIVAVSRIDIHQKRLDLLIEAFYILSKKYPELKLIIYGDGSYTEESIKVKEMIATYGLKDKVVMPGKIDNIQETIIKSKMYILTSDYEGIPNSLLEAMAIGLPVISTDCSPGGAKLLINNKENGILIDRGNVDAIVDAVDYYMKHPDEADRFGNKAMEVNTRFSTDIIMSKWMDYVESFLNKNENIG